MTRSLKPLIDKEYLLQKFPGKGGWTYVEIPEIAQNKKNPFGWVTVSGCIDDHELKQYKLMPMGNGKLFLPVKAAIRKKIKKEAGDSVKISIKVDESPTEIPEEIKACFEQESQELWNTFLEYTDGQKKAFIDWIYAAKNDDTRARRIIEMLDKVSKGLKLHDTL